MNIYNDKTLYKIIACIVAFVFVLASIIAAVNGGLKAILFILWLGIAFIIFFGIAAFTVTKLTKYSSKKFVINYIDIGFDIGFYKFFLMIIFLILLITSTAVWNFLDQRIQSRGHNIPASEMPGYQETP